ncbi:MAG: serine--tRNA ligase [Dehalococcoidales bacterium]|nr:serine--tRNA ligase [Dehalococcoidales bacterium]
MLDLKFIRENAELVREALEKRCTTAPLDGILELDTLRRRKTIELEELRRQRKETARQFKGEGAPGEKAMTDARDLRTMLKDMEEEVNNLDKQLLELLLQIPNIPHSSVPVGKDETEGKITRTWQAPKTFDFTPKPHWEIGESLDIIDFARGIKLSGSRFYVLKGLGARLQRALIAFMLDLHTRHHGYKEIYPPWMVKRECMVASGNLPKFADNLYHDEEDDLWFVPTAEVPLTNLHRDEIIPPGVLPIHYAAYTACFRREKMSAGKDVRGIKRGHQFDKVELYKFVEPENSMDELEKLVLDAEAVCERLGLPYRIKALCTGDLGFSSMKTYDIEVWAPGSEEWLEVSSCSNCGDFQARRANIRYRATADEKPRFVHTLNGSGLAIPRIMIAVLENYQQADGSVAIPEVLQAFMGHKTINPD